MCRCMEVERGRSVDVSTRRCKCTEAREKICRKKRKKERKTQSERANDVSMS